MHVFKKQEKAWQGDFSDFEKELRVRYLFFYNRVVSCLIWIGCDRSWEGAQKGAPAELITTSASVLFEVKVALESSFCRILNQAIDQHLFLQIIYDIWAFQRKLGKYKQQCFLPSYSTYYLSTCLLKKLPHHHIQKSLKWQILAIKLEFKPHNSHDYNCRNNSMWKFNALSPTLLMIDVAWSNKYHALSSRYRTLFPY